MSNLPDHSYSKQVASGTENWCAMTSGVDMSLDSAFSVESPPVWLVAGGAAVRPSCHTSLPGAHSILHTSESAAAGYRSLLMIGSGYFSEAHPSTFAGGGSGGLLVGTVVDSIISKHLGRPTIPLSSLPPPPPPSSHCASRPMNLDVHDSGVDAQVASDASQPLDLTLHSETLAENATLTATTTDIASVLPQNNENQPIPAEVLQVFYPYVCNSSGLLFHSSYFQFLLQICVAIADLGFLSWPSSFAVCSLLHKRMLSGNLNPEKFTDIDVCSQIVQILIFSFITLTVIFQVKHLAFYFICRYRINHDR